MLVISTAFFILLKVVLTTWRLGGMVVHVYFRNDLLTFLQKDIRLFIGSARNLLTTIGSLSIFTVLILIHEHLYFKKIFY